MQAVAGNDGELAGIDQEMAGIDQEMDGMHAAAKDKRAGRHGGSNREGSYTGAREGGEGNMAVDDDYRGNDGELLLDDLAAPRHVPTPACHHARDTEGTGIMSSKLEERERGREEERERNARDWRRQAPAYGPPVSPTQQHPESVSIPTNMTQILPRDATGKKQCGKQYEKKRKWLRTFAQLLYGCGGVHRSSGATLSRAGEECF